MVRHTFATDLLGTTAFAHGVEQLDAVGVDDPEHSRGGQEGVPGVSAGKFTMGLLSPRDDVKR